MASQVTDQTYGSYAYPDPMVPLDSKLKKEWGLKYAWAMWWEYRNFPGLLYAGFYQRAKENRAYRHGMQSIDIYKKRFDCDTKLGNDQSYLNLNWEIMSPLPKFFDILMGIFEKRGYNIVANAIDPVAQDKKKQFEWENRGRIAMEAAGMLSAITKPDGTPLMPQDPSAPKTNEELDLYLGVDYKLAEEIAVEQAIRFIQYLNRYPEEDKNMADDLMTVGLAAIRDFTKPDGSIGMRRCIPENMVIDFTQYNDFRNSRHAGEIIMVRLDELMEMAGEQFTEEEYQDIAKKFANQYGNPAWNNTWGLPGYGRDRVFYATYRIPVMDYAMFSDAYLYSVEEKTTGTGKRITARIKDSDMKGRSDEKVKQRGMRSQIILEGKWIVGTNYMFDWGMMKDMYRKSAKKLGETKLPFTLYAPGILDGTNKSMVERVKPLADEFQILWLKYQQLVMAARPPGVFANLDALTAIPSAMQSGTYSLLDILDVFNKTGNLFYRTIDEAGNPIQATPITPQDIGFSKDINTTLALMKNVILSLIRELTGVNEMVDASTPDPDMLVGNARIAVSGTNNAIQPIWSALKYIREELAKKLCGRLQSIARNGDIDMYDSSLGSASVSIIRITADMSMNEFGFLIEDHPTDEEAMFIEQQTANALAAGTILLEDANKIRGIPNLKLRANYLAMATKRRTAEKQAQTIEQMQAQAQANAQSTMAATQSEMQLMQAKAQARIEELKAEYTLKDEYDAKAHARRMEMLAKQGELTMMQIEVKGDIQEDLTRIKAEGDVESSRVYATIEGEADKETARIKAEADLKTKNNRV